MNYTLLAAHLKAHAIEYFKDVSDEIKSEEIMFPIFPKAEVRDNEIVIIWDAHNEEVLDYNEDINTIESVASEIELELKATKYAKMLLIRSIEEIIIDLNNNNIPKHQVNDIIYSAYCSLRSFLVKLDEAKVEGYQ